MNNEQIIRRAYELAEKVDVKGWVECFTSDGTFTDMSIGVTYRGPDGPTGLGKTVEVYAKAFPEMHPELYRFFNVGDVIVVEPCCDVFRLVNGKIQSFNCYPSGTVIFAQLGVPLEYRSSHRSLVGGTLRIPYASQLESSYAGSSPAAAGLKSVRFTARMQETREVGRGWLVFRWEDAPAASTNARVHGVGAGA